MAAVSMWRYPVRIASRNICFTASPFNRNVPRPIGGMGWMGGMSKGLVVMLAG